MTRILLFFLLSLVPLSILAAQGCAQDSSTASAATALPETNYYEIQTPRGRMVVRLYDETPQHRDNFKQLVAEQAYDSTLFHRVISGFMAQGGDPNSLDDDPMNDGNGGPGYTVPAEIRPELFHRRGALSAARQNDQVNPERASSGSQFYVVHGTIFPEEYLRQMESTLRQQIPDSSFSYSDEAVEVYTTEGGAPNLDGMYTVFGEVVEGLDVLDDITRIATPSRIGQRVPQPVTDRPLEDVWMVIRPLPDYRE